MLVPYIARILMPTYACMYLCSWNWYLLVALPSMQSRVINVNAFGDDYVSFVPMHLSFSPDGRCILISTGEWVRR